MSTNPNRFLSSAGIPQPLQNALPAFADAVELYLHNRGFDYTKLDDDWLVEQFMAGKQVEETAKEWINNNVE
jgi:hypothetical protein